jgi:hypothetical protein
MKHILLLVLAPLLLTRFTVAGNNESEAQTYLKLYTTVTGTADNHQEKWLLANYGTRRIIATVEILAPSYDSRVENELKNIIVEPKASVTLGCRSSNGSAPNTIVIIKASFTPAS